MYSDGFKSRFDSKGKSSDAKEYIERNKSIQPGGTSMRPFTSPDGVLSPRDTDQLSAYLSLRHSRGQVYNQHKTEEEIAAVKKRNRLF